MTIQEAVKVALGTGNGIKRSECPFVVFAVASLHLPIGMYVTTRLDDARYRYWNPTPEDILANDWEVEDEKMEGGERGAECI